MFPSNHSLSLASTEALAFSAGQDTMVWLFLDALVLHCVQVLYVHALAKQHWCGINRSTGLFGWAGHNGVAFCGCLGAALCAGALCAHIGEAALEMAC